MKTRNWLMGFMLGATTLLSACGGGGGSGSGNPFPQIISDFAKSLIAMVTGSSCDTATPADVNGLNLPETDNAIDANTLAVNCNS